MLGSGIRYKDAIFPFFVLILVVNHAKLDDVCIERIVMPILVSPSTVCQLKSQFLSVE